jgi:peptidase MA superfamily protein
MDGSFLERYHIPVIAAVAILVIIGVALLPKPTFKSRYSAPQAPAVQSSQVQPVDGSASSALFENLTPAGKFDTFVENGLYPDQRAQLGSEVPQAFEYVSQRFGPTTSARFKAAFAFDQQCSLHGITREDERTAQVYTCNDIPRGRALAIMAHELVHQLEFDRYGQAHLNADMILSEGVATWAAGKYWLGGHADFRSYMREQSKASGLLPLATNVTREDFSQMNQLYYQWASFVEFLIDNPEYGRQKFDRLYVTGRQSVGSADYVGVYGKDLSTLEQDWQAWLNN